MKISIVLPAYNEEVAIKKTIKSIPLEELLKMGYKTEVLVVDNNSHDKTSEIAKNNGARVIREVERGYGCAYKTGFRQANGEIIITADADGTYPLKDLPKYLEFFKKNRLEFLTTNRFTSSYFSLTTMPLINRIGNQALSLGFKILFNNLLKDSQSGMWIFKKGLLKKAKLRSNRMSFSQEIKVEAIHYIKCKWAEIDIPYSERLGRKKLKSFKSGFNNLLDLVIKKYYR